MSYSPPVTDQRFLIRLLAGSDVDPLTTNAVLEGLAALVEGEIAPLGPKGDRDRAQWTPDGVRVPDYYHAAYRALVDGGWCSLAADERWGGQGLSPLLMAAMIEDLGSADLGFSLVVMLSQGAVESLVAHGSPQQQAQWLPKIVSGEWTATMNLTEPQAGSDVGALRTTAERRADGSYRIKGQKIFITFGEHDLVENIVHLVLARSPDAPPGTRGISLFLVPRFRADGSRNDVRCASIEHKMGIHASPTCVMLYGENDDCIGEIIGGEGEGMRAMFTMMNNARLNVGLQGVSVAEAATQAAVAYARERVQSARAGAPSREPVAIIEHPDVRRMLLRMKALTMGARALVYEAFAAGERGDRARMDLLTPLAKAWATDIGVEVASLAVQVHGGMGFIEETGVARYYRDARIAPIYEGTNGIQAADLVNRKLGLDGGAALDAWLAELRSDGADEPGLLMLVDAIAAVAAQFSEAGIDDRLAGSYPLMTMMAVATVAGLYVRQCRALAADDAIDPDFRAIKQAAARYFLDIVVGEALGLRAAASAGAALYYSSGEAGFAVR